MEAAVTGVDDNEPQTNVNMMSALLHVLSDLMRSTTTLVESIIILQFGINGARADGWSALIVCSLIAVGALGGLLEWVKALREHLSGMSSGLSSALLEDDDDEEG